MKKQPEFTVHLSEEGMKVCGEQVAKIIKEYA